MKLYKVKLMDLIITVLLIVFFVTGRINWPIALLFFLAMFEINLILGEQ